MKLIVMCGGYGTKIWPLSRKESPKQFTLKIDGKSPFRHTIELLLSRFDAEDIILATSTDQKKFLKEQASEVPEENYFLEPCYRSHGAATAMIMSKLIHTAPDETFVTVQSDVLKIPGEKYLQTLDSIDEIVQGEGRPVTAGIIKDKPTMGCDYFRLGDRLDDYPEVDAYELVEFLGRTDYERTKEVMKESKVCVHTNYWSWTPQLIVEAYHKYTPDWGEAIDKMSEEFEKEDYSWDKIHEVFGGMRMGPIEDLLMEFPRKTIVIDINHEWFDFGSWSSVADYAARFEDGKNHEKLIEIDAKGNYVSAPKDKAVAVIGFDNIAVIDTEDGLLVTRLDKAGEVGKVVDELKKREMEKYL